MGPPQLCPPLQGTGGGDIVQIKQLLCDLCVCRQKKMGRWLNQAGFFCWKTDDVFKNLQNFCTLHTS